MYEYYIYTSECFTYTYEYAWISNFLGLLLFRPSMQECWVVKPRGRNPIHLNIHRFMTFDEHNARTFHVISSIDSCDPALQTMSSNSVCISALLHICQVCSRVVGPWDDFHIFSLFFSNMELAAHIKSYQSFDFQTYETISEWRKMIHWNLIDCNSSLPSLSIWPFTLRTEVLRQIPHLDSQVTQKPSA